MATQYTPILQLALPVTGELNGTWGDVVNDNITSMVEEAIAGLATINTWTANSHTLTTVDGLTDEARCAMIVAQTGAGGTALTASGEIICPARTKLYVVSNQSAYQVTIKTAAGTGIAVAAGDTTFVFCDGTNVLACVTQITNGHITGNLTVDGNTTLGDASGDTVTINAGTTTVKTGGAIRFEDNAGGEYVALKAPAAVTTYTLTLPIDDGTNGQALITDGSGNLSWSTAASGDVYGPASATNTAVALFDGVTGKLLKNSGVTVDGSNNVSGVAQLNATTVDLTNLEVTNIKAKDGTQAIAIADSTGAITLSSGVANGVAYLNGSKVLTTGSALTFDGTNLGVGISPSYRLHLGPTGGASTVLSVDASSGNSGYMFINGNGGNSSTSFALYQDNTSVANLVNRANAALTFGVNSAEQMRLTSTGLGIGTSSPVEKLDVRGNAQVGSSSTSAGVLRLFNSSSNLYIGVDSAAGGNTGIPYNNYFLGSNAYPMTWYTNSTLRMTLDSSGNLGLGVTPSAWADFKALDMAGGSALGGYTGGIPAIGLFSNAYFTGGYIYKTSGYASYAVQINGQHQWFTAPSGTAGNAISFTQAMTLDASGNLLVGTTSQLSGEKLSVKGPIVAQRTNATQGMRIDAESGLMTFTAYNNANTDRLQFVWNQRTATPATTEVMRIDYNGNLLVGTTTARAQLTVERDNTQYSYCSNQTGTGDKAHFRFAASGTTVGTITSAGSTTAYNTSSDYRLKENIQPMQNALATVAQLNPVTYTWKADGSDGQGFIAHELQAVVPDCVTGEKDAVDAEGNPVYQGIDTSFLVATLTKAIQELKAELDATKAEVAALKGV